MGIQCLKGEHETVHSHSRQKQQAIKKILRRELQDGEFKDICMKSLSKYYDYSSQLRKQQKLRKSILGNSHYEANNMNIESDQTQIHSANHNRHTILSIPINKRQQYVLRLIAESYLFLDLSDCLDNRDSFDKFMKHQLTKDSSFLDQSFTINNKAIITHLQEQLKSLDPSLITKLEKYVKFCRKVKHDFSPQNKQFLYNLSLRLQKQFLQKYLNKNFLKDKILLRKMFNDMDCILKILSMVSQSMGDVHFNQRQSFFQQDGQFFTQVNFYTMITSIIFENANLTAFIVNKIKRCFHHRLTIYCNQYSYNTKDFIHDFIIINLPHPKQQNLLFLQNQDFQGINVLVRSSKFLQKIFRKSVPIYKLKVIYELNQEMSKELCHLRKVLQQRYNIQLSKIFNRQTQLLAIKWLLKNNPNRLDNICAHILFTYRFVHRMHLMDQKGSCLTSFIQEIQHIFRWSPN